MFQTVSILNGKLAIGPLEFQLYDEGDAPATLTYRGEAAVLGQQLRIVHGRSTAYDFTIANHPTQESVDYAAGYEKALSQRRRSLPKSYSDQYYFGWLDGWNSKN